MCFIGVKVSKEPTEAEVEAFRLKVKEVYTTEDTTLKKGIRAAMRGYLGLKTGEVTTVDLLKKTLEKVVGKIEDGTFGQDEKDIIFNKYEEGLNYNVYSTWCELDAVLLGAILYKSYINLIGYDNVQIIAARFEHTSLVPEGGLHLMDFEDAKKGPVLEQKIQELKVKFKGTTVLAK